MPFNFGEDAVNLYDMVSATCTVNKGDMPIDIYWKNLETGRKLFTSDGITIGRMTPRLSTLSIESVMGRHSGRYTCIASNSAGIANYTAELTVNGTIFDSISLFFF